MVNRQDGGGREVMSGTARLKSHNCDIKRSLRRKRYVSERQRFPGDKLPALWAGAAGFKVRRISRASQALVLSQQCLSIVHTR